MMFLADQYAGPKGCWVEFFGRPASAHKAIALLALENDARVSVSSSLRIGPMRFELNNDVVLDPRAEGAWAGSVQALTQWYTSRLEALIRRAPDQYWWLHRRWKDTRGQKARKARAA